MQNYLKNLSVKAKNMPTVTKTILEIILVLSLVLIAPRACKEIAYGMGYTKKQIEQTK